MSALFNHQPHLRRLYPHIDLFCAFTSNMLPTITHNHPLSPTCFVLPRPRLGFTLTLDPLPVTAFVDVRFPTSLTSDGSDPMYVLDPFLVRGVCCWTLKADIGTRNAIIRARTSRTIQTEIWLVIMYAPIASQASFIFTYPFTR